MINRRQFVKGAGLSAAALILPTWCIGKQVGPNSKLNVAVIGVGGRGRASVDAFSWDKRVNMVAFCDVDDVRAAKTYKDFPNVPHFRDFRVMLDKMGKDIDAVAVCTPDHMHYPIAAWAMARGKHVFCEKPLARTVWETREMRRLAKKYGVITQMGNQGHTSQGWRIVKEFSDAGILGKIKGVYAWTDRPCYWPQGNLPLPEKQPVPETLDFDLWLGVAPHMDYSRKILPFNWRGLRNYGTGACGDMAVHILDGAYAGLGLTQPVRIESTSTEFNDNFWPSKSSTRFDFKSDKGVDGKIEFHWFDGYPGINKPKSVERVSSEFLNNPKLSNGSFIVGEKETMFVMPWDESAWVHPQTRMGELKKEGRIPPKTVPRSAHPGNPQAEWVSACLEGKPPMGSFEYGGALTELTLLGMCGILAKQPLDYDADKMSFTNAPEMDKYLASLYPYRKEFIA